MLRLFFLLLVPGIFAEFLTENSRIKFRNNVWIRIVNSLLYSYFSFLLNISIVVVCYIAKYDDLFVYFNRRMNSVEDIYLFALLTFIQLLVGYCVAIISRIIKYKNIEKVFFKLTNVQKNVATLAILLSATFALIMFIVNDNAENCVIINEVCSKNDSVIKDENGKYSDYVELYNSSKWSVSLRGFRLTDQTNSKRNKELDDVIIPAKGYYIVWLNTKEEDSTLEISSKGDSIYLENSLGKVTDKVDVPELKRNISYARITDGADVWQEEMATPALENDPLKIQLKDPVFSAESGFYEEEFLLSIQAEEGQKIYYTLDSSYPDENANLYTSEILVKNVCNEPNVYIITRNVVLDWDNYNPTYGVVDKVFVVRAVAVDDLGNTSDVITKTYLVDMEQYKNKYVVSLVTDPNNLFGDDGIYVTGKEYEDWYAGDRGPAIIVPNFLKKGREYEVPASFTLINNDVLMDQEVGIRIQGASTRKNAFKRLSIYARKEYSGNRYFEYDLFGRDTHAMFTRGDFSDSFIHSLVEDRAIGTQKSIASNVFLDGELWYITNLREKYNEDYLSAVYGVSSNKVEILERVPNDIINFIGEHDLSKKEDYDLFCDLIDIQSYIDYMAINIYVCNMDISEEKNYKVWRTTENTGKAYEDGKLRWLLYDTDCLDWYGQDSFVIDSFAEAGEFVYIPMNQHEVYKALRKNKDFCAKFVLTFMDLVNQNFAYETVEKKLANIGYDMTVNNHFYEKRFDVIVPALAREFELQGSLEKITLSVNNQAAGSVQINTIKPDLSNGSWTGSYYTDYPVKITAIANEGYTFVGWKCGEKIIKDTQIEVQLTENGCLWEAIFE